MQRHEYPAGFPVRLALKDLQLVSEVADDASTKTPLLDAVLERFTIANEELASEDVAAVYEVAGRG